MRCQDGSALLQTVDDVHAAYDLAEDRVVVVQAEVVHHVDVQLRVSRVSAARGQPDRTSPVAEQADLVPGERTIPPVFIRSGTPSKISS